MEGSRLCRRLKASVLAVVVIMTALESVRADDNVVEVTALPGWEGALPSKTYSGQTHAGTPPSGVGDMYFHWIFIESEHDPNNDPLIIWYQGGPGASSLFGLLVEFGPWRLNVDSLNNKKFNETGVPQLLLNPDRWTKFANVMVVDNPPPVGFSFCTQFGPGGDGRSCGSWNDSLVAEANHRFLINFAKQMPNYVKNPVYIAGESYAGVYVPTIVRELLKTPNVLNLTGFIVGDGCLGTEVLCGDSSGPYWSIEFLYGHGQFSNRLYGEIMQNCNISQLKGMSPMTPDCKAKVDMVSSEVGGYYSYNLYDTCYDTRIYLGMDETRRYWGPPTSSQLGGAVNDYPCPGDAMAMWLNRTDVRKALGLPANASFVNGDNGSVFNYTLTEPNLLPFYEHVVKAGALRVLVYNGDTDPGINSFITQDKYTQFFDSVGILEKERWRPWTLDGRGSVAGYVIDYGSFDYLTIRGSGHMVPEFKPQAAHVFMQKFVQGDQFPRYNPRG